jgi:glycosyltransferase involved in cell wall biosynthesis
MAKYQQSERQCQKVILPQRVLPVVLQIGPAPGSSGGMASVIEETLKFDSNEFQQRACPSWTPEGKFSSFPHALRTAVTMCAAARSWDIAHVHMSEYGSFIREGGLLLLARALRRPALVTLHGANLPQHVTKYPRLTRLVFGAANIVLCLGEVQQHIVTKVTPKTPTRIVANPVSDRTFRCTTETRPASSSPIFLFAGEIGERKGHDRLISAWSHVLRKCPAAKLRVAGPIAHGYQTPQTQNVEYLGNLSRSELLDELSKATATVLPSRAEVLPMVLIESQAQGTPVVYTKVGEWRVFADSPGIRLVDTDDRPEKEIVASLAHAMIQFADSEVTDSAELVDWTRRKFSTTVVSLQLDSAYRHASRMAQNNKSQRRQR